MSSALKILNSKITLFIFIILSFVLQFVIYQFYIDEYLNAPQLINWDNLEYCYKEIGIKNNYFVAFFIFDFLWFPITLFLIYRYAFDTFTKGTFFKYTYFSFLHSKCFFMAILVLAGFCDFIENVSYLIKSNYFLFEYLVMAKNIFYALAFLFFLVAIYKKRIKSKKVGLMLKASFLSITCILVLALLITKMEQGRSLVIDLLDHPLNLLGVLFYLYVLSLIVGHYPVYLLYYLYYKGGKNEYGDWIKLKDCLGYGILYYDYNNADDKYNAIEKNFKPFRNMLGILVILSFIYCLFFTYNSYHHKTLSFSFYLFVILLVVIIQSVIKEYRISNHEVFDRFQLLFLSVGKMVLSILLIFTIYYSATHGWYYTTYFCLTNFLFLLIFYFSFGVKQKEIINRELINNPSRLQSAINTVAFKGNVIYSDYIPKLRFIKITGFVAIILLILSMVPSTAHHISPILVFLLYLHVIYGTVIILLKYYIYGNFKSQSFTDYGFNTWLTLYKLIPFVVLLVFAGKKYYNDHSNDMTYLNRIKEPSAEEVIHLDTFVKKHSKEKNIYIASWGGGLRATYFNLLLFRKLSKERGTDIMEEAFAVSGASGGMLGLGFYFGIQKENKDSLDAFIDKIGNYNFVTTDLSYLLIKDRLPIPKKYLRDRSIIGMNNYWRIISDNSTNKLNQTPYESYWKSGYDKLGYYPIILTNSTRTRGDYGLACSAKPKDFHSVFGGATDLLNLSSNETLPFYEALSASERFPFFSATATVDSLGHFIDGGYFENSGIISLLSLRRYMAKTTNHTGKDLLLIITNSKENYVQDMLEDNFSKVPIKFKLLGEADYESILNGITNTDRLAYHLKGTQLKTNGIDTNLTSLKFSLRYPLAISDFENALGGIILKQDIQRVRDFIKRNNNELDSFITNYSNGKTFKNRKLSPQWDFAHPTLARLLSRPSVNYYKAVMENDTRLTLNKTK